MRDITLKQWLFLLKLVVFLAGIITTAFGNLSGLLILGFWVIVLLATDNNDDWNHGW